MIKRIIEVIKNASNCLLEIYGQDIKSITYKDDGSPLTIADVTSNQLIIQGIKEFSDDPIVTEETYIPYDTRKRWKKFWLVDPLDGTKDFLARNDQFTINIALIENNKPALGVVCAPALRDIYHAISGIGAFKNSIKIYNKSKREELIGADSIFHSTPEVDKFFATQGINNVKKIGAALKICKLAEGEIDVYPRLNQTKEWDTAAAHIIANESGCKLVDVVTGKELTYNKNNMANAHFIASRNDLAYV